MMKTITLELGTRPDAEKLENPKKFEYIGFIKLSICIIIYTFFKLQIQVFYRTTLDDSKITEIDS